MRFASLPLRSDEPPELARLPIAVAELAGPPSVPRSVIEYERVCEAGAALRPRLRIREVAGDGAAEL